MTSASPLAISSTSSLTPSPPSSSSSIAIGIDLGTTYSCVAVWRRGGVEIIPNEFGHRTTPSYVSFYPNERIVGDAAKLNASANPKNTLFDAKRLIGRKFHDPTVQNDISHFPFQVVSSGDSTAKPLFPIEYCGESRLFSAEEISAMILQKMKLIAENYLQQEVTNAVITVPAYFNDAQRQATKDAGQIAGLNVLRIINEPTAAAISYGLENKKKHFGNSKTASPVQSTDNTPLGSRSNTPVPSSSSSSSSPSLNVLIFDLGGGTFDVSLLQVSEGVFHVKATAGNTHLGGEDFDQTIMDYFLEEIEKRNVEGKGKEMREQIAKDEKKMRRLRSACEKVKCSLSTVETSFIELEEFLPHPTSPTSPSTLFSSSLTRTTFESLCHSQFINTLEPVEQVLRDSQLDKLDIDEIVLVGGSTRIPKIQKLLSEYFLGKSLNNSINPDEAVAYGAAVQAAILNGSVHAEISDILLIDIIPLSLGLETVGGIMQRIIPRNSIIPCKFKQIFSTHNDNQNTVEIAIYEGERVRTQDNNLLGIFELKGIPNMVAGVPVIEVTFEIDSNGILSVLAKEKSSGVMDKIVIENNKGRMKKEEIRKVMDEEEKWYEKQIKWREMNDKRRGLEKLACFLRMLKNNENGIEDITASGSGGTEEKGGSKSGITKGEVKLSMEDEEELEKQIKNLCEFVSEYEDTGDEYVKMEEIEEKIHMIEEKQKEMEEKCNPIIEKALKGNIPIMC